MRRTSLSKLSTLSTLVTIAVALSVASCGDDDASPPANGSDAGDGGAGGGSDATSGSDATTPTPDGGPGNDSGGNDAGTDSGAGVASFSSVVSPNSIRLVPTGWAGLMGTHVFVCGTGCRFYSVASGAAVLTDPTAGGPTVVSGLALDALTNADEPDHRVSYYTTLGSGSTSWNAAVNDFGLTVLGSGGTREYVDAVAVPGTGAHVAADRLSGIFYNDEKFGSFGFTPNSKLNGGADEAASAFVRDVTKSALVLAVPKDNAAGTGLLYLHDRNISSDAVAVASGNVGAGPRRVRCAGDVCLVTNAGSGNVTPLTWDGASAVTMGTAIAVGSTPVGVDLATAGANTLAVVANSGSNTLSVLQLTGASGTVTKTVSLTGCTSPGDVVILPGSTRAAVACNGSSKVVLADL